MSANYENDRIFMRNDFRPLATVPIVRLPLELGEPFEPALFQGRWRRPVKQIRKTE